MRKEWELIDLGFQPHEIHDDYLYTLEESLAVSNLKIKHLLDSIEKINRDKDILNEQLYFAECLITNIDTIIDGEPKNKVSKKIMPLLENTLFEF